MNVCGDVVQVAYESDPLTLGSSSSGPMSISPLIQETKAGRRGGGTPRNSPWNSPKPDSGRLFPAPTSVGSWGLASRDKLCSARLCQIMARCQAFSSSHRNTSRHISFGCKYGDMSMYKRYRKGLLRFVVGTGYWFGGPPKMAAPYRPGEHVAFHLFHLLP